MATRLYLSGNPPRLITSKPGYNAGTGLADIYKTFDSDWFNGAGIRWIFRFTPPNVFPTNYTVTFPYSLDHVPKFNLMWGGYTASGASLPSLPGVSWPATPNSATPYWTTNFQKPPAQSVGSTVGEAQIFSNRFELRNIAGGYLATLIVYQS